MWCSLICWYINWKLYEITKAHQTIRWINIFGTPCFTTEYTLRSIPSKKFYWIKAFALRWYKNCWIYTISCTSIWYCCWLLLLLWFFLPVMEVLLKQFFLLDFKFHVKETIWCLVVLPLLKVNYAKNSN